MNIKKLFIAAAFSFISVVMYAQKAPGTFTLYPRVGMNLSSFSGDAIWYIADNIDSKAKNKYKAGVVAGAELQYQISPLFAVSGGVMYSQQGTKFENIPMIDEKPTIKHNDIIVPVLLNVTFDYGFSVKMGLQPEFLVDNQYGDMVNKVNLSLPVGVAYEYKNFCLDVRYNIGQTKIYNESSPYETSRNSTFLFTLGYGIDL